VGPPGPRKIPDDETGVLSDVMLHAIVDKILERASVPVKNTVEYRAGRESVAAGGTVVETERAGS